MIKMVQLAVHTPVHGVGARHREKRVHHMAPVWAHARHPTRSDEHLQKCKAQCTIKPVQRMRSVNKIGGRPALGERGRHGKDGTRGKHEQESVRLG